MSLISQLATTNKFALLKPPLMYGDINALVEKFGAFGVSEVPAEEEQVIAPGHGSGEYPITTIGGVILNKFNMIQYSLTGVTQSGGTSTVIALQTSTDGGSTWSDTADYEHIGVTHNWAGETEGGDNLTVALTDTLAESSGIITGNNAPQLFGNRSASMEAGSVGYTYVGVSNTEEVVNAIRFKLYASSGTPIFTGGNIDLVGYR